MGRQRYRGPIEYVEQAMAADMPVRITCQHCARSRQMHAYQLAQMTPWSALLPLWKVVPGFYCKACHRKVSVVITAPMRQAV